MSEVPVWLEFTGVPPQFFNEEGLEHVAGALGHPLYLHPSTANLTNIEVAKVFTIINPSVPIPEVMNVQFESGVINRVEVNCPWLPPTCSHCQEIGHTIRRCPTAPITCPTCKSSSHSQENCPRSKKNLPPGKSSTEDPAKDPHTSVNRKNPSRRKKEKKKKMDRSSSPIPSPDKYLIVDDPKRSLSIEEKSADKKSGKKLAKSPQGDIDGTSRLSRKSARKARVVSSSSDSSEQESSESESSDSPVSDASSDPLSEDDDNPTVDTAFTEVISKKQRRYGKKAAGKVPKKISIIS